MLRIVTTVAIALISSVILTGIVRQYVIARGIMDIPNARSSHTKETPRGGGVAIAAVYLAGVIILCMLNIVPVNVAFALCGGGSMVAIVGWVDDKKGLSAKHRAMVHAVAAIWAVSVLGGYPHLYTGVVRIPLGVGGSALAVVGVIWMTNLYNFMDGIDGLAAGEAVVVASVAGALLCAGGQIALGLCAYLLAASAGGFLAWNWPPAKIFMGDVGSGMLGFTFGVLAIASENAGGLPVLGWAVLLCVFVVDSTATLLRRVVQGERWYDGHRSHAYQLAVANGHTHNKVTGSAMLMSLALAALGWLVLQWTALLLPVLLLALAGSLYVWWLFTRTTLYGTNKSVGR